MSSRDFKFHDNVDRDVIEVGKDSFLLILQGCREYFSAAPGAWGFTGIALALLVPSLLADGFRDLLSIPGETVRAVFIVLGIVMLGFAGFFGLRWYRGRNVHNPEMIIARLLKEKPEPMLLLPPGNAEPIQSLETTGKRVGRRKVVASKMPSITPSPYKVDD